MNLIAPYHRQAEVTQAKQVLQNVVTCRPQIKSSDRAVLPLKLLLAFRGQALPLEDLASQTRIYMPNSKPYYMILKSIIAYSSTICDHTVCDIRVCQDASKSTHGSLNKGNHAVEPVVYAVELNVLTYYTVMCINYVNDIVRNILQYVVYIEVYIIYIYIYI